MAIVRVLTAAVLLAVTSCALPGGEHATPAPACKLPASITPAPAYTPPADEVVTDEPTAQYLLALTWAPEDCREHGEEAGYAIQCRDNSFGFVLHGLWPNGAGRRAPRYCGPAPALSPETARKVACMTPSTTMQQHEWAAHGTCGWSTPEAYFAQATTLWAALKLPELDPVMTAGDLREAFVATNPSLKRDGIYIKTVENNRLMDVRFCYDLQYRPKACTGSLGAGDDVVLTIEPRRR